MKMRLSTCNLNRNLWKATLTALQEQMDRMERKLNRIIRFLEQKSQADEAEAIEDLMPKKLGSKEELDELCSKLEEDQQYRKRMVSQLVYI